MLEAHKRRGAVVMATAFVASLVLIAVADCQYCSAETGLFVWLWYGMHIDVTPVLQQINIYGRFEIPIRYLLVTAVAAFLVGLLLFIGAIGASGPTRTESARSE